MTDTTYSVDTSALIDGLERYYPEASFPALWDRIDALIAEGRFFMSEEVWEEVKKKDEAVKAWCEPRRSDLIVPTDAEIAGAVTSILDKFPRLVMTMKGRNRADAFVIAVARLRGASVITGEGADGTQDRPKIPYICHQMGIPVIRFVNLIQAEGWVFGR